MNTPSLSLIYSFVLSLFFVFESYAYFSRIIPILIDRSFGDVTEFNSKLNRRKAVLRSWFFGSFSVACGYALYMIKHNENKYLILFYFVAGIVLMFLLHYFPKKIEKNTYYKNLENSTPIAKGDLKPSEFNIEEIKIRFDNALKQNYFNCEFYQFEDLLKLNTPRKKIIWRPVSRKKMKDRQLLLTFLNDLFQNQFVKIERNEVCLIVNKYFDFNEEGHHIKENPLKPDNIYDWMKKI